MMRLIPVGACALFLLGCTAEKAGDAGNAPSAMSVATDTSAKFELGKDV